MLDGNIILLTGVVGITDNPLMAVIPEYFHPAWGIIRAFIPSLFLIFEFALPSSP